MTPGVYSTSIHSIPMHVIISSAHIHNLHISEIINSQSRPSCLKKSLECISESLFHPFYSITILFILLYTCVRIA